MIFDTPEEGTGFCFQAMFATTACTIVSGAMAERTKMEAYLVFVMLMTSMARSDQHPPQSENQSEPIKKQAETWMK